MSPMSPRLLRPRQTGFDPRSIANLALWLDANDTATLGPTSSGPSTVSNNGPIKYWGDKSGSGRHLTNEGADSVCPTFLAVSQNSRPAVSFDGGDSLAGSWNVSLTSQTVLLVVMSQDGSQPGARTWTQSDAGFDWQTTGGYIPILADNTGANWQSYADSNFRAAVTASKNVMNVVSSRHTGSQIQNSLNNGTAATYSHTLNKTFTRQKIGQDFGGTGSLVGRVCEILVYSRSVSDAELTTLSRYLGTKWGITVA